MMSLMQSERLVTVVADTRTADGTQAVYVGAVRWMSHLYKNTTAAIKLGKSMKVNKCKVVAKARACSAEI